MYGGISIVGAYNWDNTLFDGFSVPVDSTGSSFADKDIYINNILLECGDLPLCYQNPEFIKSMISVWSEKNQTAWTHFADLLKLKYNPIENYNRNETNTTTINYGETITKENTESNSGVDKTVTRDNHHIINSGTDTDTVTYNTTLADTGTVSSDSEGSTNNTKTGSISKQQDEHINIGEKKTITPDQSVVTTVSAYNDNTLKPRDSVTTSGNTIESLEYIDSSTGKTGNTKNETETYNSVMDSGGSTSSITDTHDMEHSHTGTEIKDVLHGHVINDDLTGNNDITYGKTVTNKGSDKHSGTDIHTVESNIAGNIGVTTTQQMMSQELDIIGKLSLIDYVTQSFKEQFCLLLY